MIDNWISPYTDADVAEFCEMLRIGPEKHDKLASALNDAAREWQRRKQSPISQTSAKARSDELRQFAKRANAMAHALNDLSDAAWLSMQYASDWINSDRQESRIDTVAGDEDYGDFGYERSISVWPDPETSETISYANVQDAVRTLARMSGIGRQTLPDLRRGPSQDFPLECWVRTMRSVSYAVGVPFTRDVAPDGSTITPAACLCDAAYFVLDPQTLPSRVLNAMKNEIKAQRETPWKI